ncbi:MAG: BamA/TamA family outer membrane protein, partial [Candidatus Marinimicrobia bacterium]|nr:BamA/TamA family outer membrane protein [Candidatus Neomarinimicrobiota bacterium]
YCPSSHSLFFDITSHHFRDIYEYGISDESLNKKQNHDLYDERNMTSNESGLQIFSQDKSGIYNLYMSNPADTSEGYITNVTGGAFMPDISADGKVIYSLFENGTYTISIMDDVFYIDEDYVGYSDQYYLNNSDLKAPIIKLDNTESYAYVDQFPNMFIMPKVMLDYGTIKPGFYFFSSEIINRLSIFGGASVNQLSDIDLFFIFDFKRFYPTLFFEAYYLTRNTTDKSKYQEIYNITDDIKFRLVQFRSGLKIPIFGSLMEVSGTQQWYRAFIQEQVMTNEYGILEAGAAYDYFRGLSLSADWSLNRIKRSLDASINPSNGFTLHARIDLEKNDFIEGLNLSESGTLTEEFNENNLTRLQVNGSYHYGIPWKKRWTLSLKGQAGWISSPNVDSFFHFYLGGIPGVRGYPFYSIQGTKSALLDATFRMPIFMEKNYKAKWIIFQNSTLGAVIQAGDAWTEDVSIKKSVGIQWRINGFSFYNFPTAIEVEYHQPLDTFKREINETTISYGENGRAYVKVLFDF